MECLNALEPVVQQVRDQNIGPLRKEIGNAGLRHCLELRGLELAGTHTLRRHNCGGHPATSKRATRHRQYGMHMYGIEHVQESLRPPPQPSHPLACLLFDSAPQGKHPRLLYL